MISKKSIAFLSLGSLLGALTGMSVSEVTSTVVSSLLTIVVAIAVYQSGKEAPIHSEGQEQLLARNAGPLSLFCVACLLFALLGLHARSHNWFAPTVDWTSKMAVLTEAGFTDTEAKEIAVFEVYGILPKGRASDPVRRKGLETVLYSYAVEHCGRLHRDNFGPVSIALTTWAGEKDSAWELIATLVANESEKVQEAILANAWQSLCE